MRTASSPEAIVAGEDGFSSWQKAKGLPVTESVNGHEAIPEHHSRMSDAEYRTWLENVRAVVSANQRESALVILRQATGRIVKGGVR